MNKYVNNNNCDISKNIYGNIISAYYNRSIVTSIENVSMFQK